MNRWDPSPVVRSKTPVFLLVLLTAVLLLPTSSGRADSGHVALAYPLEGITIDGDFSDWPEYVPSYSMEILAWGERIDSPEDLSASLQVGYHFEEQVLYFAFEVKDDVRIAKQENDPDLYGSDHIRLSIFARGHNELMGLKYRSTLYRRILLYEWGQDRASTRQVEGFETAVVESENGWRQEWRIQRGVGQERNPGFDQGDVLSIECSVWDIDVFLNEANLSSALAASAKWLSWTSYYLFFPEEPKPGDLILLPEDAQIGTLQGSILLEDGQPTRNRRRVLITKADDPNFQVHARSDRKGNFKVDLPVGHYHVSLADGPRTKARSITVLPLESESQKQLTLTAPFNHGQSRPAGPGRSIRIGRGKRSGPWRHLQVEDGLPSPTVLCGLEDSKGNLWFGTDGGGVIRFDGTRFTVFTTADGLASDQVCSMAEDDSGRLWFGTGNRFKVGNGVSRYDGKEFVRFTEADGLPSNTIRSIIQRRDGTMWFAGHHGMSSYDGREFVTYSPEDGVRKVGIDTLLEDRHGELWILDTQPRHLRGGRLVWAFHKKDDLDACNDVAEDSSGNLWFARGWLSRPQQLPFRFDGNRLHEVKELQEENASWINSVAARDETVWFGGSNRVAVFDGKQFDRIDFGELPLPGIVQDIVVSRNGRVWLCTAKGIYIQEPSDFEEFTDRVPFHQERGGTLWFRILENGAIVSDQGEPLPVESKLPDYRIKHLATATGGGYWVVARNSETGFQHGFRFDGSKLEQILAPEDFNHANIHHMVESADGRLWLGHFWGLNSYHVGERRKNLDTSFQVDLLHADADGSLWIGMYGGLGHLVDDELDFVTDPENPLSSRIFDIIQDPDGFLWVATPRGLVQYDGDTYRLFTTEQGLPSNAILSLYQDRENQLWVGTSGGGLCLYDGTVFQNIASKDGFYDSVEDIFQDRDDNIWVTAAGKTYRYSPNNEPPGIRILEVTTDRLHGPAKELELSGHQDRVSFEFEGVSFKTHPDAMAYVYRLMGFHEDWRPVYEGQVEYQNLPTGDYVFQVKAVDRNLSYSEKPASVSLRIRHDYAQMALVGGLGVATLGVLGASAIAFKHRRQRNRALIERNESLEEAKRSAEREKNAAESANRAKSAFLANMSHEIRTPMNAILGYAQLMARSNALSESDRRSVQTIKRSGDHLLSMINDILDLSKIEAGRLELDEREFDLKELLDGLEVMFRHRCEKKELEFKVEISELELRVLADEGKLRQVLINLLGNAVKFTEQGRVTLRVCRSQGMELQEGRCRYRFDVIDTGPGISKEEGSEILKPFVQGPGLRHEGGTGLGLAISRRLIELMGGVLNMESAVGEGSRFWFEIPLQESTKNEVVAELEKWKVQIDGEESAARRLKPGYRVNALVVDDVPENRDVLSNMLRETGCEAETAEEGPQALERIRRQPFDIVFLDIRMPGMDGMETLKRIQSELQHLKSGNQEGGAFKVVAVSASVLMHQRQRYLKAGFDAFIGKPFRFEEIYRCLSKLLGAEFEMDSTGDAVSEHGWADLDALRISQEMKQRLRSAAGDGSATRLSQCISELETGGGMENQVARILKPLVQEFNMEEILEVLDKLGQ